MIWLVFWELDSRVMDQEDQQELSCLDLQEVEDHTKLKLYQRGLA